VSEDDAQRRFVEDFALLLGEGGVPRMPARVFACVLADDAARLTAGELAERLSVSPAAISGAVRYLVQVGMLVKGRAPGERRDHYRLGHDPWYELITQRTALLQRWQRGLSDGIALLGPDRAATQRLQETREFFGFLEEEMPALMERWRARQHG
jgi:DNA-binding transcriptional regulator GbsR (MarR family)